MRMKSDMRVVIESIRHAHVTDSIDPVSSNCSTFLLNILLVGTWRKKAESCPGKFNL